MEKKYDVVIVGAGPSGAQCARHLANNSDLSVLLVDKTQEIGEPKKSTAGTFDCTMRDFDIPIKVAMQNINDIVVEGPTTQVSFPTKGYVLEFGLLKRFLVDESIKHGIDVSISTNVTHPIVERGRVCGVDYHSLEGEGSVRSDIVVDASGPPAVIARQIGLRNLSKDNHAIGMEFEMERLNIKNNNMMLFKFDQRFAPGGYSWIFSTGARKAKVGNCWFEDYFKKVKGNGSSIAYLHKWIRLDNRLKKGSAVEIHGGDAYTNGDSLKRVHNGLVCVGDSVCSVHPLTGEGIRAGMTSGTLAAKTIINALKRGDVSVRTLNQYQKDWEEYAHSWKTVERLGKLVYTLSNKRLDTFVKLLSRVDQEIFNKFVDNNVKWLDCLKVFKPLFGIGK